MMHTGDQIDLGPSHVRDLPQPAPGQQREQHHVTAGITQLAHHREGPT